MTINIRQLRVDSQNILTPQLNAARKLVFISQGVIFGVNLLLSLLEVMRSRVGNIALLSSPAISDSL